MEPVALAALATSVLAACQSKGIEAVSKIAGDLTQAGVDKLWGVIKNCFTTPAAQEAVAELKAAPTDTDVQAQFRHQLKKLMEKDADLVAEIKAIIGSVQVDKSVNQTATAGDNSKITQIVGSGNTVG